jgi:hypothetical protein
LTSRFACAGRDRWRRVRRNSGPRALGRVDVDAAPDRDLSASAFRSAAPPASNRVDGSRADRGRVPRGAAHLLARGPRAVERVRVAAELLAGVEGVDDAALVQHLLPGLAELGLELFHRHVELPRLHDRRLARDRVVVLVDVLLGVDGRAVDAALGRDAHADLGELVLDEGPDGLRVRVGLHEDEGALARLQERVDLLLAVARGERVGRRRGDAAAGAHGR